MFDPFALLNQEKQYPLDSKKLEAAYFEAQKRAHPDRFVNASPADRLKASQLSTSLNQAYRILRDPLQRADYLLQEVESSPPPAFLEQLMNWKEQLAQGISLQDELSSLQKTLFDHLETAFTTHNYKEAKTTLYKLQYLQKML